MVLRPRGGRALERGRCRSAAPSCLISVAQGAQASVSLDPSAGWRASSIAANKRRPARRPPLGGPRCSGLSQGGSPSRPVADTEQESIAAVEPARVTGLGVSRRSGPARWVRGDSRGDPSPDALPHAQTRRSRPRPTRRARTTPSRGQIDPPRHGPAPLWPATTKSKSLSVQNQSAYQSVAAPIMSGHKIVVTATRSADNRRDSTYDVAWTGED